MHDKVVLLKCGWYYSFSNIHVMEICPAICDKDMLKTSGKPNTAAGFRVQKPV